MPNRPKSLAQIDKEFGTEYASILQHSSFMGLVQYMEAQFDKDWAAFMRLKPSFDEYLKIGGIKTINKREIVQFLNHDSSDILAEVLEYAVGFFTQFYKLDDFEVVKQKLIDLTNNLNSLVAYRHDYYKDLLLYLKED